MRNGGCGTVLFLGGLIYVAWGPKAVVWASVGFGVIAALSWAIPAWERRRNERVRLAQPCRHGVPGALIGGAICQQCSEDGARLEAESRRRETERRAEEYRAWVRRIRLPEYLRTVHPREFEQIACRLFEKMGYDVELTKYTGDGGVDGRLRKDGQLSLLQCKRTQGSVGEPVLRDLFGAMAHEQALSAFIVTTGSVSSQARQWAVGKPIRVVELPELQQLVRAHLTEDDVVPMSFNPSKVTAVPRKRECPVCGRKLRLVRGQRGRFMGCSGYPECRYTRSIR
jgi:hypothetical protein